MHLFSFNQYVYKHVIFLNKGSPIHSKSFIMRKETKHTNMANCNIHGFLNLFAVQTVLIVTTTLLRGVNSNATSYVLTSEPLLRLFRPLATFYNVQNGTRLFDANASLLNIPDAINIRDDCQRDLKTTVKALENGESWALQSK